MPWSTSPPRRCVYCGNVGPRTIVLGGYAHKYCIPKESPDHPDNVRKRELKEDNE
jgi:hypothetical protein